MKKIIVVLIFISNLAYAEVIQENGVTVEYEISGKHIYAKVMIKELEIPYKIDIFIDDKIHPEMNNIGTISTEYDYPKEKFLIAIIYIKTNTIDEICNSIIKDLYDEGNKVFIDSYEIKTGGKIDALKNKSTVIINIIKKILIESGLCNK